MAAASTAATTELRKTFNGRPAYHSRANKMMLKETVCPRSGWMTISTSAISAAGTSGTSISRMLACSMRREASRCAPQIANATLVSSEGCMDRPA
ncbi:Uncharacterised protein [Mycobacteroides abscessus subsp. abscessus]|nr:Uncharacterised protein [Mycobacteroides abscessus subsp. abscessus]SIL25959.1 Uncharacterised protein [Mycobacteroides abscessus subsp. abscessus]SIM23849.1 Uncharacterised protein [Mycobacteroides abscessus subsp. abscessus]SKP72158.1 Uncharacterised protein [Mycobacteroides abscessus subsp. abscessus]SKT19597.1 Uncharacterised protein [Mycobacteroides abscessus subsp. abscessus]